MSLEKWKTITTYKDFVFDGKYEVSNWENIRRDKKTPFVTCELDLKTMKIRQCYGINNTQITDPDFIQFKEEWLKLFVKNIKRRW